jgi:hypothetical protein
VRVLPRLRAVERAHQLSLGVPASLLQRAACSLAGARAGCDEGDVGQVLVSQPRKLLLLHAQAAAHQLKPLRLFVHVAVHAAANLAHRRRLAVRTGRACAGGPRLRP